MTNTLVARLRLVPGVVWIGTCIPMILGPAYALFFFSMAHPSLFHWDFTEGWTLDLGFTVLLDFLGTLSALYGIFAAGVLLRSEVSWDWLRALAWSSLVMAGIPALISLAAFGLPIPFFWVPVVAAVGVIRALTNEDTRSWIFSPRDPGTA